MYLIIYFIERFIFSIRRHDVNGMSERSVYGDFFSCVKCKEIPMHHTIESVFQVILSIIMTRFDLKKKKDMNVA